MSEVLAGLPVMVDHGDGRRPPPPPRATTPRRWPSTRSSTRSGRAIEGTIKDTDPDIYERIETAQGLIKDGAENDNAERIQQGADDQADRRRRVHRRQQLIRWTARAALRSTAWVRRVAAVLVLAVGLCVLGNLGAGPAGASPAAPRRRRPSARRARSPSRRPSTSSREVRASIDRTLRLLDAGDRDGGLRRGPAAATSAASRPWRRRSTSWPGIDFRFEVEDVFARVRGLIDTEAPTGEVRDRIVTLRGLIDESERQLTATGLRRPGPRVRPVVHAAAARGARGGAAPVGAAHLPRDERARPPPQADPRRRRAGRRRHRRHVLRRRRHLLGAALRPRGARGGGRACWRWRCSSTSRSG